MFSLQTLMHLKDPMAVKVRVTLFRVILKASKTRGLLIPLNTPITPTTTQTTIKLAVPTTPLMGIRTIVLTMTLTPTETTMLPTIPTVIKLTTPTTDLTTVIEGMHDGEAFGMASSTHPTPQHKLGRSILGGG